MSVLEIIQGDFELVGVRTSLGPPKVGRGDLRECAVESGYEACIGGTKSGDALLVKGTLLSGVLRTNAACLFPFLEGSLKLQIRAI